MSIKLLRHELLGVVLCLMGTDYINTANAQQTDQQTIVTKAEAALADKIKCRDFRKNANGTWTSGPNTKIGVNAFPQHTFNIRGVSIGGADLATVLNRKCSVAPQARPQNRPPTKSSEPTETPGLSEPSPPPSRKKVPSQTAMTPIATVPQPRTQAD
jgi:hypothetical protein